MCEKVKIILLALVVVMVTAGFQANQDSMILKTMYPVVVSAKNNSKASFDEKVLRQILVERDDTKQDKGISDKSFNLDPKYLFSDQRDPFVPLMTESGNVKQKKQAIKSRKKKTL